MKKIKAGIIGGAGYTGGELIRILLRHPSVHITYVHSRSNAGNLLSDVHSDLEGETDLKFSSEMDESDVVFLCVGHGEARKFLGSNELGTNTKIIDLSQDFRLEERSEIGDRKFVYGLPELNKEKIRSANNIANPGCFATAVQLGLLPLAKSGLLEETYATGITGSTGAGQGFSQTSHFSWRANNIQPYKVLSHQHISEIRQSLRVAGGDAAVHFVPWRGDFTRGILVSSITNIESGIEEISSVFRSFYKEAPFTVVTEKEISLKQVVNTNKCLVKLEVVNGKLVVHTAIDNLLKGASGQAVQNMNLMFGLEEKEGLELKASAF